MGNVYYLQPLPPDEGEEEVENKYPLFKPDEEFEGDSVMSGTGDITLVCYECEFPVLTEMGNMLVNLRGLLFQCPQCGEYNLCDWGKED